MGPKGARSLVWPTERRQARRLGWGAPRGLWSDLRAGGRLAVRQAAFWPEDVVLEPPEGDAAHAVGCGRYTAGVDLSGHEVGAVEDHRRLRGPAHRERHH